MPMRQYESLRYFQFETLAEPRLVHAVFSRHGGVSPKPWHSLNVGSTVGDDHHRVTENRRRLFEVMDRDPNSLYDVWQVHSARYVIAREPRKNKPYHQADVILTDTPGITLLMRFADCVPIMLYEERLAHQVADALLDEGIYVIGFSYPVVPKGQARIRVQISAAHQSHHFEKAIEAFQKVGKRFGVLK